MDDPTDDGLAAVLQALGVPSTALLGRGGEASVYAMGRDRVVRILHDQQLDDVRPRIDLVDEIRAMTPRIPFDLPEVLDIGAVDGRWYVIERRLRGTAVNHLLAAVTFGEERAELVVAHLDTAARLGDLQLRPRSWFGDLIGTSPVRSTSWKGYLEEKVSNSMARAPGFERIDAESLCIALPISIGHPLSTSMPSPATCSAAGTRSPPSSTSA